MHRLGVELVGAFETYAAIVIGRQAAETVGHVEHRHRAVARHFVTIGHACIDFIDDLVKCLWIFSAHAFGAAYRDGFEVLGTHDCADAGAPRSTMLVIHHAGITAQRFAGLADAGKAHQRVAIFLRQQVFGFPDRLAPDFAGVTELDLVVFDVQVNRFLGNAFDDQQIVAGHLQFTAEFTAGIGAGDGAGECTLGHHGVASASGSHGAGEGASGKDYLVFG